MFRKRLDNFAAAGSRTRPRGGFTLVEILVVIVILGIAAAIIVPQMGTRDDLRATAAARMLMADLTYAQNRAISTQARHYVVFGAQNYQIMVASGATLAPVAHPITKASSYVVNLGVKDTPTEFVSLGTVSFEGKTTVSFDELGQPYYYDAGTATNTALGVTGGSTVEVKSGTHTVTITVEPYTGEIKVN